MTIKGEMFSGIHQIQLSTLICIFTYSIDVSDEVMEIFFKQDNELSKHHNKCIDKVTFKFNSNKVVNN